METRAATPSPAGTVTVVWWAGARALAGVAREEVALSELGTPSRARATVGEVLDVVEARHPGIAPTLAIASILLDGRTGDRDRPVVPGDVVEVLPPFAGG